MDSKKKGFWFFFPRVIVSLYPLIIFAEPIVSSIVNRKFNAQGFVSMYLLGILISVIVYWAWKVPKVGGWIIAVMGIMAIIGASNSNMGIDIKSLFLAGIPITLSGIIFLLEGYRIIK